MPSIHLRDVSVTRLAGRVQTNAVLVDGQQAVIIVVMKSSEASTLDVVRRDQGHASRASKEIVPKGVKVKLHHRRLGFREAGDRGRRARNGDRRLAGRLSSCCCCSAPGGRRSSSSPRSRFQSSASLIALHALGQSINVMTLGGLALAVGILVDNAAVMIENIDTHIETGAPLEKGDHRRRQSDRSSNVRRHARHHDRLGPTVPSKRDLRLGVPADGRGGHLRDDRLIYLDVHAGADHGEVYSEELTTRCTACGRRTARSETVEECLYPLPAWRSNSASSSFVKATRRSSNGWSSSSCQFHHRLLGHRGNFPRPLLLQRARVFPEIKSGIMQMHMRAPLGTRIEVAARITSLVARDVERCVTRPGR